MNLSDLIERLEQLDREATKGPWIPCLLRPDPSRPATVEEMKTKMCEAIDATAAFEPGHDFVITLAPNVAHDRDTTPNVAVGYGSNGPHSLVNADVCSELRNALPLIIESLKVTQAAMELEREAAFMSQYYSDAVKKLDKLAREFRAMLEAGK